MADDTHCATTSSTGSTRYLLARFQPTGGVLSCKGSSHAVPDPADQSAVKTGAKRVQNSEQVLAGLVPADGGRVVLQGQ